MLFNSGAFLKFFAAFVLLYWLVRGSLKARNVLIVIASYVFYAWWGYRDGEWDLRFTGLLLATSSFDFCIGLGLERLRAPFQRKALLTASIVVNLGVLGFFKYCNFFVDTFAAAATRLGLNVHPTTLAIILPIGISFYTFQSMSYAIDVYRREIRATRSYLDFLAFVSFFPQLVAGPIQRAARMLPQFHRTLTITAPLIEEGIWLMIWGMFKKVVIADNMAPLVEMTFDSAAFTGPTVIGGTLAFALQIYCDFSGYSDIARGAARLLGFDIVWNFSIPYAAVSLRDFWRRWHISLSTWLRDYLYISLGGNRRGTTRTYVNLLLTMLLGGLWHGAAWNFVLWGAWHGLGLAVQRSPLANVSLRITNSRFRRAAGWLSTLLFVLFGWLLFRARSFAQIKHMILALSDGTAPPWFGSFLLNLTVFATPLVLMEVWQSRANNLLVPLALPGWIKAALQGVLLVAIIVFWRQDKVPFIYFQF